MAGNLDVADLLNDSAALPGDMDDDDEEVMTAPEVLQKLEEAWLNEKFCPDLLPVKSNLVECMLAQIDAMEDNIARAKKGDFRITVHRMEIDRIRYVVSSYLRLRLSKIEAFTNHVMAEEAKRRDSDNPLMSDAELQFAQEYKKGVEDHLKNLALKSMPHNVSSLNEAETSVLPNLDSHVFVHVAQSVDGVLVEEETHDQGEEIIDLVAGDQHVFRYRPVAALVEAGQLQLM